LAWDTPRPTAGSASGSGFSRFGFTMPDNAGLVLWIALNFFPVGWPQLDAVYEHGLAYARSLVLFL
jgi:hypothetical protein